MAGLVDQSNLQGEWKDRSKDILEIGDPTYFEKADENVIRHTVSNPHPGFGKDPNILNEYGHTVYPMWVTNTDNQRVVVNSPEEEAIATGKPVRQLAAPKVVAATPIAPAPVATAPQTTPDGGFKTVLPRQEMPPAAPQVATPKPEPVNPILAADQKAAEQRQQHEADAAPNPWAK